MTLGQQVTIIIASWCHMHHKLYQQHKDLGVWAQAFQHKEVCLNCQTAAPKHSHSQGEITSSEDVHAAHKRTENRTKKWPWTTCAHNVLWRTEETESYFPIASIKQSFWKAFPLVSHLLCPFDFLREQLWTLEVRKEVRKEGEKVFFFLRLKQMSLWTLPQQVRG